MYLLEGKPVPDYATFARFRSIHFAPCAKWILAEMSNLLYELGEISGESIFIDGTKIETCANKYTFVWKKAVTKNQEKLLIKIADLIAESSTGIIVSKFRYLSLKGVLVDIPPHLKYNSCVII